MKQKKTIGARLFIQHTPENRLWIPLINNRSSQPRHINGDSRLLRRSSTSTADKVAKRDSVSVAEKLVSSNTEASAKTKTTKYWHEFNQPFLCYPVRIFRTVQVALNVGVRFTVDWVRHTQGGFQFVRLPSQIIYRSLNWWLVKFTWWQSYLKLPIYNSERCSPLLSCIVQLLTFRCERLNDGDNFICPTTVALKQEVGISNLWYLGWSKFPTLSIVAFQPPIACQLSCIF